jgi:hypothetical protein
MESKSIKEKIFYWGGMTLISTVILGGSYYIYQSIFGSEEKDDKEENEINSLNDSNQEIQNNNINNINNNIEINSSNNISNINSIIFPKNENNNIGETQTNIISNKLNNNLILKEEEDINEENDQNISNNINIFNNNIIFMKSFGLNIDESKIFKNGTNKFQEDGAMRLIIYINYLAEKFYILDNPTLDEKRREALIKKNENNNELLLEQKYLELCNETLDYKRDIYQIAAQKIINCLKVRIVQDELNKIISSLDPKQIDDISIKIILEINSDLNKYDLDYMDINKTKEAYIYYLKTYIENTKNLFEQKEKNENDNIEGKGAMLVFKYMSLKLQTDDQLYIKYKIVDEHLKLLVYKYNLFNDNDIIQLQKESDVINRKLENNEIKI